MFKNLITMFTGFSGSGTGLLVLALVWVLSLGVVGYKSYTLGEDHINAKQQESAALIRQAITEAGSELGLSYQRIMTDYLKDYSVIKEIHDKTIVKVPMYITTVVDSKCSINNGFVELHNSAVLNKEPKPVDATTEQPSIVKLSEVAGVVTTNYSICNANAAKLIALQAEVAAYKLKIDELQKTK